MLKVIIFSLMSLFLIIGCSGDKKTKNYTKKMVDGIQIISNKNVAADDSIAVELKLLATINGNAEDDSLRHLKHFYDVDFDSEGNIFILDGRASIIRKYAPDGSFLKAFGRKGQGPGEFQYVNDFFISADTVIVPDSHGNQLVKFSPAGKLLQTTKISNRIPDTVQLLKNGNILGYSNQLDIIVSEVKQTIKMDVMDKEFNPLKTLLAKENTMTMKELQSSRGIESIEFNSNSDKIFIAENSDSDYLIYVYDFDGNLIAKLKKSFARIPFSKEEKGKMGKESGIEINGEAGKIEDVPDYKQSIAELCCDKYGNLLVRSAVRKKEESIHLDYFFNNIFINRIDFKIDKNSKIFFKKNKLVCYNRETNTADIYAYSYNKDQNYFTR